MASPYLAEIVGRSAAHTLRAENNAARRLWRAVYSESPETLPSPSSLGLPAINSDHPTVSGVVLTSYDVNEEAPGSFLITANYAPPEESDATVSPEGEDEEDIESVEVSREWSGGESSRDLTADAVTGKPVMLPTGEPFESVPSAPVGTTTFSVTRKIPALDTAALAANCTVNAAAVTIDGVTIAPHCGLLRVSQRKIYGSELYTYEITFNVSIVSNPVALAPDEDPTDIGHDVALLLAGFRYYVEEGGRHLEAATEISEETWEAVPATTPALLTPTGEKYTPADPTNPDAYYLRVAAIKEATWNAEWFR